MITSLKEYCNFLYLIQTENPPETAVLLPGDEPILNIDLSTRQIEYPEFLSVATDHRSETIYFKAPRYFDNVDLAQMSCVIQFINAAGESGLYVVPFIDTTTLAGRMEADDDHPEILIPWLIEGKVTAVAGKVSYAVQFFRVDDSGTKYVYNLNTLSATSTVLQGQKFNAQEVTDNAEEALGDKLKQLADGQKIKINYSEVNSNLATAYEALINKMNDIKGQLNLYWVEV